jgi:hypothetical protein
MINKNAVDDPLILWEAIKGFIINNATAFFIWAEYITIKEDIRI